MTRVSDLSPLERMILQRVAVAPFPLRPNDHMAKEAGLACIELAKIGLVVVEPANGTILAEITEKGARLAAKIGKK